MAYTTIDNPELYFQSKTYTANASGQSITFDGSENMQPDWLWIKARDQAYQHSLRDSVRGPTKTLRSNGTNAEATQSDSVTSFDSNGFTLGADSNSFVNQDGVAYISWGWSAGTTSGLSGGNITPSAYSYNASAGFGIYKYTGNGSSDQTIPHGLGKKPQLILFKNLESSTNWVAQTNLLGNRVQLVLNGTDANATDSRLGASDSWDTTNFNVGTYVDMNTSGESHIAYVFCNIKGYSKVGTYKGNGNTNGTFVYTGFKPAFVLIKSTSNAVNWQINDNGTAPINLMTNKLFANTSAAQDTGSENTMDFLSNGFKPRGTGSSENINGSGYSYIYMAFAENPFVNSNGVPCNAR